jgi:hypothetical protein
MLACSVTGAFFVLHHRRRRRRRGLDLVGAMTSEASVRVIKCSFFPKATIDYENTDNSRQQPELTLVVGRQRETEKSESKERDEKIKRKQQLHHVC